MARGGLVGGAGGGVLNHSLSAFVNPSEQMHMEGHRVGTIATPPPPSPG